jgi:nitrogen PTS system EIIA component
MRIIELLDKDRILPAIKATDKRSVIEELAGTLVTGINDFNREKVIEVLLERERLGSTGIGDNIAIPHGKLPNLDQLVLSFGRSLEGVNFDSMDGKPTNLFFLLMAPENSVGVHLKALAKISRMLKNTGFRQSLMAAADAEIIYQLIAQEDTDF